MVFCSFPLDRYALLVRFFSFLVRQSTIDFAFKPTLLVTAVCLALLQQQMYDFLKTRLVSRNVEAQFLLQQQTFFCGKVESGAVS
jgi:hypothetical protein